MNRIRARCLYISNRERLSLKNSPRSVDAIEIRTATRIAIGPGNINFISIRQVSSNAVTLRRGKYRHHFMARCYAAAAADTALGNVLINN